MLLLSRRLSNRLLPFEWISLAFCAVWLFATQIPFTHFFATRSAQVHAFVGTVELPSSIVQTLQNQLGFTNVYKDISYRAYLALLFRYVTNPIQNLQCVYWPSFRGSRSCSLPLLLVSVLSLPADASKMKRIDMLCTVLRVCFHANCCYFLNCITSRSSLGIFE